MVGHAKPLWPPQGAGVASVRMDDLLALEATGGRLAQKARARLPDGARRSMRIRARGMEYAESRPYQSGDDVRSIDWRVTARTARTHTKLYEEERERPVWLCVDLRSSMRFGTRNAFKSVLASHVAALLGWAGLAQGDRIGCACWTDAGLRAVPPRRGRAALESAFGLIVRAGLEADPAHHSRHAPGVSAVQILSAMGAGAQVWVLSDFMAFTREQLAELCSLGRRHRLTLVQTVDPLEDDPPPVAGAWLTDPAGRMMRFNPHAANVELAPGHRARERLRALANRPGVELAMAHTSELPEAIAQRLLLASAPNPSRH